MENMNVIQAANFMSSMDLPKNLVSQKQKNPNDTEFAMAMSQAGILPSIQPSIQPNIQLGMEAGFEMNQSVNQPIDQQDSVSTSGSTVSLADEPGEMQLGESNSKLKKLESQLSQVSKSPMVEDQLAHQEVHQANNEVVHQTAAMTIAGLSPVKGQSLKLFENDLNQSVLNQSDLNQTKLQSEVKTMGFQNPLKDKRGDVIQEGVQRQIQQPQDLMKNDPTSPFPMLQSEVVSKGESKGVVGQKKSIRTDFSSGGEFLKTLNSVKGGSEIQETGVNLKILGSNGLTSQSQVEQLKTEKKEKSSGREFGSDEKELSSSISKTEYFTGTPFTQMATVHGLNSLSVSHTGNSGRPIVEIEAQVIPGANAQDRLSTDAMIGVSGGIRNLAFQSGGQSSGLNGGEMRIRLKPDHLGELHVRVMTKDGNVGLQIQASDEKAKKIIEDSIHYLKENLSAHHLSLNQVDLTVGNSQLSSNMSNQEQNPDSRYAQSHLNHQGDLNQDKNSGGQQRQFDSWQNKESFGDLRNLNGRPVSGLSATKSWDSKPMANGRLDVKA